MNTRDVERTERSANGLTTPTLARPFFWWQRRRVGFMWGCAATAVTAAIVIGCVAHFSKPYAPLYGYGASTTHTFTISNLPTQTISTSTTGKVAISVLAVADGTTETIAVKGQKCSSAAMPIETRVDKTWIEVQPPGWIVDAPVPDQVTRPPGCLPTTITSAVPVGVLKRLRVLAGQHTRTSLWKLQGKETPTAGGSSATWTSLSFAIDYTGPA